MMKHALISLLFLANLSYGQKFESSISLGLLPSQVDGDGIGGFDKISYYGGIGIQAPFKNGRIRVEAHYDRKGSRFKNSSYTYRFNYLDFIPTYHYYFSEEVSFGGGLYIGKTLAAKTGISGNLNDISSQFYTFDYGWQVGGSYRLTEELGIDVNYNRSLFKISYGGWYNNYIKIGLSVNLTSL